MRSIDHFSGTGELFRNGEHLTAVQYDLGVYQEFVDVGSGSPIGGLKTVEGMVTPLATFPFDLFDEPSLTLVMDDGMRLDFFYVDSQTHRISAKSGFYWPAE